MSFDPNVVSTPEPPAGAPGEPGADEGILQPSPDETAAGAEHASGDDEVARLKQENRQLHGRVGLLSQELQAQYGHNPAAGPPGFGPPLGAAPPPQVPATPPAPPPIEIEESVSRDWEENYGVSREHLASFAQGIQTATIQQTIPQLVPLIQHTASLLQHASNVTNQFFGANEDLRPYQQDVTLLAQRYLGDEQWRRGRPLDECLGELGNQVRLHYGLPVRATSAAPSVTPREATSVEGAQTAPGGSAGGAEGTGTPRKPSPPRRAKTPAEEYIDQRGNDHVRRVLGGTRLGKAALDKTKIP